LASFSLTASLIAPGAIFATPAPQDDRIYDRDHKDYHRWDDREKGAWERFQDEKHIVHHEFNKAKRKEQREYWSWRHEHPDHD
jgi:hypothetical protein